MQTGMLKVSNLQSTSNRTGIIPGQSHWIRHVPIEDAAVTIVGVIVSYIFVVEPRRAAILRLHDRHKKNMMIWNEEHVRVEIFRLRYEVKRERIAEGSGQESSCCDQPAQKKCMFRFQRYVDSYFLLLRILAFFQNHTIIM